MSCIPEWAVKFNYGPYALKAVFTVPAAWSEETCDKLRDAARKLGLTPADVLFVTEAEAAVASVARDFEEYGIEEGDVVTVCDAGGSAVDLISYRIDELEPLQLTELTAPESETCGSTMLDTRFEDQARDSFGAKRWQELGDYARGLLRTYWQNEIKHKYTGEYDHDFPENEYVQFVECGDGPPRLILAGSPPIEGAERIAAVSFEPGKQAFWLHKAEIDGIFEPAIQGIEELVLGQMGHLANYGLFPQALILVGGLGSSKYLLSALEKRMPNLKLIQPPDAWTAVVRRALYRGLEKDSMSLISPRNYGLKSTVGPDAQVDDDMRIAHWDQLTERYYNPDAKLVIISKGDNLTENVPKIGELSRDVPLDHSLVFRIPLISCDCDLPDENDSGSEDACQADFIIAILEADFSAVPRKHFCTPENSKQEQYYHFHFDFVTTPKADTLVLEAQIKGVSYGAVEVPY
ncbi:hypothetical protein BJY00DRAFT_250348 [Aspergillus carlsbadensis]|nr:hypothetical protein BJY00DRAFT_250348 [Aspergillus carlsbadensis]